MTNPQIIGFGISDHETFSQATQYAKGAIIGSAFIKHVTKHGVNDLETIHRTYYLTVNKKTSLFNESRMSYEERDFLYTFITDSLSLTILIFISSLQPKLDTYFVNESDK